jgi:hypothetical protein
LVSGKLVNHGSAGATGVRRSSRKNGVTPTQARPLKLWTSRPSGSSPCTTAGPYDQCRNESQLQVWYMTGQRTGQGGLGLVTGHPFFTPIRD